MPNVQQVLGGNAVFPQLVVDVVTNGDGTQFSTHFVAVPVQEFLALFDKNNILDPWFGAHFFEEPAQTKTTNHHCSRSKFDCTSLGYHFHWREGHPDRPCLYSFHQWCVL